MHYTSIKKNIINYYKLLLIILLIICNTKIYSIQLTKEQKDSIALNQCLDTVFKYRNIDYNKAYNLAIDGLKKYNPQNNILSRIKLLQLTANIEYYYKNDFNQSILHLNEMKFLSEKINYSKGLPWVQLNMGNMYYYQKDIANSMKLYNLAKKNAEIINDSNLIACSLIGIADILFHRNQYDTALILMNHCLDYSIRNNNLELIYLIYDDIAHIYKLERIYDSSYFYYEKTYEAAKKYNSKFGIVCSEVNLEYGKYLLDSTYNPIPSLIELQKECKKEGFMRLYYEVVYTISNVLQDFGYYKESLNTYKHARFVEDSLTANEKIRRVAELESDYYIEKKDFENKKLSRINEINSLKLRNRQIFILAILFILIQTIILLYIIYRKYLTIKEQDRKIFEQERIMLEKEKEVIEHKLQSQERDMTSKVMKIYQHNQLIQKITKEIKDIREYIRSEKTDINTIDKRLQSMNNQLKLSSNQQMWNEFEKTFTETNPGYLERLSTKFTDLAPNEIRLCIFLFLNLRSKDISIITQQSVKTINVARTRLRKKLNLDNTNTNLSSFLRQI